MSGTPHPKPQRGEKRPAHLAFIRSLPCCACGAPRSEAAHVRYSDAATGKVCAVGQKPGDEWTVPLCAYCHRTGPHAQHKNGEREWWAGRRIDPLALSALLFEATGDRERGEYISRRARALAPWRDDADRRSESRPVREPTAPELLPGRGGETGSSEESRGEDHRGAQAIHRDQAETQPPPCEKA